MSYQYTRGFHHIVLLCWCCYSWHFSGLARTSAGKSVIYNIGSYCTPYFCIKRGL